MQTKKIALVFPGQGSQSLGLLSELSNHYAEIKKTFHEASLIFGEDLWEIAQQGPLEKINNTAFTQPLLLAADIAIWRVLTNLIPNLISKIQYLAGHSLGEYAALVAGGVLEFKTAMQLVTLRGLAMQDAVPENMGAMGAIIGLDEMSVQAICDSVLAECKARLQNHRILSPANFNSVGQIVISGHKECVDLALMQAKEKGAKMAVLLPVSVPSHCDLMLPARFAMEKALKNVVFHLPTIPIIKNVDAKPYADISEFTPNLLSQLTDPVQWVNGIQFMMANQIDVIIECGPGRVLTGLNKRIHSTASLFSTSEQSDFSKTLDYLSSLS